MMMKQLAMVLVFLFLPGLLLYSQNYAQTEARTPNANTNDNQKLKFSIDFQIGTEFLNYRESSKEPTNPYFNQHSDAKSFNLVTNFDANLKYKALQCGIKGLLPVVIGQGTEKWYSYNDGSEFQRNKLNYYWGRTDIYLGYSFNDSWPGTYYAGFRGSNAEQRRADFSMSGIPVTGTARELIDSSGILIGYKGSGRLGSALGLNWGIEYEHPDYSRMINSGLPGVVFRNRSHNAYTVEIKTGLSYTITPKLDFTSGIYGGKMYWAGSILEPIAAGAKWPSNTTEFLGFSFGLKYQF